VQKLLNLVYENSIEKVALKRDSVKEVVNRDVS